MRIIYTLHIVEHCVKVSSNSNKNCPRRSILKKNHDVTIMASSGQVTSSRACAIDSHRQVPIGFTLEPSRYVPSFLRYLTPNLRQILLGGDVISDVIRPGRLSVRPYRHIVLGNIVLKYRSIWTRIDKNCRRRSMLKKNHDVTIMTSFGQVTSSGACTIDSP